MTLGIDIPNQLWSNPGAFRNSGNIATITSDSSITNSNLAVTYSS